MALDPLADVSDVEVRLTTDLPAGSGPRVEALLRDASAVVRNYTRRTFTRTTETVRIRPVGDRIKFPQRPVVSVDEVKLVASNPPQLLALPTATWDGGDELYVGGYHGDQFGMNLSELALELLRDTTTPLVQVTYTHGYSVVPDDVVAVVATMVARAVQVPGNGVLMAQGTGPYNYQLSPAAQQGAMGLDAAARQVLNSYRRQVTTVEMR